MSFRLPHLASQLQIEQWAAQYDARAVLPHLMRRLISDTVPNVPHLDMPGGEHVDFGGYDGEVESHLQTPFVPIGRSVWEFGASGDPKGKADGDYQKRTNEDSLGVDVSSTTFVFVTPRRWRDGKKWAKEKAAEGKWKNVVVLTSADVYAALEASPRTHVWFSEEIGLAANSVMTLTRWWSGFSGNAKGLLTSELLVAGRETQRDDLLRRILDEEASHIWLRAETVDDVLAFTVAAIQTLSPDARQELFDRALVVFEPGALRFLGDTKGLLILLPFDDSLVRQADLVQGHHIILHTTSDSIPAIPLPGVPIVSARQYLESAGVNRDDAARWARALNKSLPLYKGLIAGSAAAAVASVSPTGLAGSRVARRLWLLGSWNFDSPGDVAVIEKLTEVPIAAVREEMEQWATGVAPVFTRVGDAWKRFDAQASFSSVGAWIGADDLQSLVVIIQDVFGAVDPALDLPRDQRWRGNIEGKRREHSRDLRMGLAKSLALLHASGGDIDHARAGQSLSGWAQLIVRAVLERASEDSSGKQWESLFDVLSLLAEAGPDYFTDALSAAIKPGGALQGKIFADDSSGMMAPTSPHVYLLWALDTIAWSTDFFGAAVALMMDLAGMDPGGESGNRPISSLVAVFRPWHPQTAASVTSRNRVLGRFAATQPAISWDLLCALLPNSHAFAIEGSGPEFHDWKSAAPENPTMADYVAGVAEVVRLCVELAIVEPIRFTDLIDTLDDLPPDLRDRILEAMEASSSDLDEVVSEPIWKKLTGLTRRHREHHDAPWALHESVLERFDVVASKFEPENQADRVEWLFDHTPDLIDIRLTDDYEAYQIEVQRRQIDAVEKVYGQSGFQGLINLARKAKTPWSVGFAAASATMIELELNELASLLVSDERAVRGFAESAIGCRIRGDVDAVIALATGYRDKPLVAARVLRIADDLPRAWKAAKAAGTTVDDLFWSEFAIEGRGQFTYANETAAELGQHGRYAAALDLLVLYSHNAKVSVDAELIVTLLNQFIDSNDPEADRLSEYDFGILLANVRKNARLPLKELGVLEWRLLRALGDDPANTSAIQRLLATSPEFFVQIVSLLYRRSDGKEESRETTEAAAGNAWHLFQLWRVVPGADMESGEVDEVALNAWVSEAR